VRSCFVQLLKGIALQRCPTHPSCASFIIIWWQFSYLPFCKTMHGFKCNCVNVTVNCLLATLVPKCLFYFKNNCCLCWWRLIIFCSVCARVWVRGMCIYLAGRHCHGSNWFICGHSSSNGVRDWFVLNSCLVIKLWLDKLYLYHSYWLPSRQRIKKPNNTMGRLIKTSSSFEVWLCLYYQVNVQFHV